jgi:hypothetical protein
MWCAGARLLLKSATYPAPPPTFITPFAPLAPVPPKVSPSGAALPHRRTEVPQPPSRPGHVTLVSEQEDRCVRSITA